MQPTLPLAVHRDDALPSKERESDWLSSLHVALREWCQALLVVRASEHTTSAGDVRHGALGGVW